MKRCISICLMLILLLTILPTSVSANATNTSGSIVYLDDGSYITVEITESGSRISGKKSGSAVYSYHDSDGTLAWTAVLNGTFLFDGTAAVCTDSSCSVTIYDDAWYVISKTAGKSGNSATGTVTMGRKAMGITIEKETINLKLTCNANGNLS